MPHTLDVVIQKFSDSKFAASFADLMMGAMGTMIVLLSFLTVVMIKGQGNYSSTQDEDMPVGLREHASMPISRLRLHTCDASQQTSPIKVKLSTGKEAGMVTHSQSKIGDCFYDNLLFPQGLGSGKTIIQLQSSITNQINLQVHLMVGGYALAVKEFKVRGRAGQDVIIIDTNSKDIISGV